MEQVLEKPKQKIIVIDKKTREPRFIWDYKEQKKIAIDPDKIVGISMFNKDIDKIVNQDRIIFPENKQTTTTKKTKNEKPSEVFRESINPEEAERSIIIDKLKDMVIKFEKQLDRYLDPNIPSGRKNRTIYLQERELFAQNGFKEFIRSIRLKVIALCRYEKNYTMDMFDVDEQGEIHKGWFLKKCDEALDFDDFHSAQEVVNAVEQIVLEDHEVVPRRLVLTKIQ